MISAALPHLCRSAAAQPLVGPPRPPQAGAAAADVDDDDEFVGPLPPAGDVDSEEGDEGPGGATDDEEEQEEEEEEEDPYQLPVTHEAGLSGHNKAVVALDVDHSGSRVITGSMDYTVHVYDFNGMKSDLRHFRQIEPQEGHPIHALSWSPSGESAGSSGGQRTGAGYRMNSIFWKDLNMPPPQCTAPTIWLFNFLSPEHCSWSSQFNRRCLFVRHRRGNGQDLQPRRPRARRICAGRHVHPGHEEHQGSHLRPVRRPMAPGGQAHGDDVCRGHHPQVNGNKGRTALMGEVRDISCVGRRAQPAC